MKMLWTFVFESLVEMEWGSPRAVVCKIVGSDRNEEMVQRARDTETLYPSTAGIPPELVKAFFEKTEGHRLAERGRRDCAFVTQDAGVAKEDGTRQTAGTFFPGLPANFFTAKDPAGGAEKFDLILCRYSIFLYGQQPERWRALEKIVGALVPDTGVLLLGKTDALPHGAAEFLCGKDVVSHPLCGSGTRRQAQGARV